MFGKDWYYFDATRQAWIATPGSWSGQRQLVARRYYQRGPMYLTESEARAEVRSTPSWARAFRHGPYGWQEVYL
jgi:hypothetical protein